MLGFSLTLLRLPSAGDSSAPNAQDILSLLDEKPQVSAWKWNPPAEPLVSGSQLFKSGAVEETKGKPLRLKAQDPALFVSAIRDACNSVIAAEPEITRMDTIAGDGDAGLTLKVSSR